MRVFGMTCDECVAAVRRGLESTRGVVGADVSLEDGTARVLVDDDVDPGHLEEIPVFTSGHYRAQVRSVEDA